MLLNELVQLGMFPCEHSRHIGLAEESIYLDTDSILLRRRRADRIHRTARVHRPVPLNLVPILC
jgi:hypothetical protein